MGVAKVPSMHTRAPCSWHRAATFSTSMQRKYGFVGDSLKYRDTWKQLRSKRAEQASGTGTVPPPETTKRLVASLESTAMGVKVEKAAQVHIYILMAEAGLFTEKPHRTHTILH